MTQELLAVIYSPSEHADNYIVFIDDENEFLQWKEQPEGQKSIALARFIGNFNIYKSHLSGNTGLLDPVSKQDYENAFFGDNKNVKDKSIEAAIKIILQHGTPQKKQFKVEGNADLNPGRGSGEVKVGANQPGR